MALKSRNFRQKSAAFLSALGVIFGSINYVYAASTRRYPHADDLKGYGPQQMTLTRYSGHPDFFSQRSLGWQVQDGRFVMEPKLRSRKLIGFDDCDSILVEQQRFPLWKIVNSGALTHADLPRYFSMSMKFHPGQMNVAQMSRRIPRGLADRLYGDQLAGHTLHLLQNSESYEADQKYVHAITASMWMVGKQVLDPRKGLIQRLKLPWQEEPDRKALSDEFDRTMHNKWVWEWGRLAQDLPEEAEYLTSVLAAIAYQELLAFGGKLEDAYVMFHSTTLAHTAYYLQRVPGTLYPSKEKSNMKDAIFLIPLAQILKEFPPSRHSKKFHDMIAGSEGHLDDLRAIDFSQKLHHIRLTQLDNPLHPQSPLVVHDLSRLGSVRREFAARLFGIDVSSGYDDFVRLVTTLHPPAPTWNTGQYSDVSDPDFLSMVLDHDRAIEISNLNPTAAKSDPDYAGKVLTGVFANALVNGATVFNPPKPFNDVIEGYMHLDVQFAVTSSDPLIQQQLRALSPEKETPILIDVHGPAPWPEEVEGQEWVFQAAQKKPIVFFFSTFRASHIAHERYAFFQKSVDSFVESAWARQLLLSNPDVM